METNAGIIDAAAQARLVSDLSAKIRAYYLFPDVAEEICARLQKHHDDGDYAGIEEGELLALALTVHLQEANHDEHLWVQWHPEPLPGDDPALRRSPEWMAERKQEARLDNYGLRKVERLAGNVGYLDIRYFHRPAWGGGTVAAAMSFLANVSALILDLRSCTGGYPGMIALIGSYLFGEEPVHLESIYWREEDLTQQYWTLPYLPGERLADIPVYLLTSQTTFSAGEGFAYDLRSRRRATLVGEKTGGGAHPGASYRLHPHFEVFIPVGRAINPITGANWEGCGVIPDVSVPQEQAFTVAYRLALQAVIAGLGESPSGPLKHLAEEARAALKRRLQWA